jgi:hypothetical protein
MQIIMNAARRVEAMFPGYFPEAKHNHRKDFGWPDTITFAATYGIYQRNGLATAAVEKTILKTWQDNPSIWESEKPTESDMETAIRQRFADLRVWQKFADADRKSMVGGYSGLILRFADDKRFNQPVDTVGGGLDGLVEVIPAWAGQLTVADWDTDENSLTYGHPKMYAFHEAAVGAESGQLKARSFDLHPDRVIIWSADGTVHCRSMLEPGYNALLDLEKIGGAGGEGFWKNAKSAPVLEVDKEAKIAEMARAMGVEVDGLADAMNEQVDDFQKGFDKLLMLQGMTAKTLNVTLPSPEHFFNVRVQEFAASIPMPQKILIGNQTGERASTEDVREWNATNMARRINIARPSIQEFINRLEQVRILPERDWVINWSDLTESSSAEKMERAVKMADINAKSASAGIGGMAGDIIFTDDEIRGAVDMDPLTEAEGSNE